jgi:hypothetical protein
MHRGSRSQFSASAAADAPPPSVASDGLPSRGYGVHT